jgi:hypothetical protein
MRAAILLSTLSFEDFFGTQLGLSREQFADRYRNDWAWEWCAALSEAGIEPALYVATLGDAEASRTAEGVLVRFLPLGRPYAPWRRLPVLRRSPPGRYAAERANGAALLPALREALADDGVSALLVQEYWNGRFAIWPGAWRCLCSPWTRACPTAAS